MVGKKKNFQFEGQKSKANAALMSLEHINIASDTGSSHRCYQKKLDNPVHDSYMGT